MLALVFSAPSAAMARKLQSAETTSYDDVVKDLCKEGTGTRTELTLEQTEVMKVTVSGGTGSPSKVWVTNEDGTILGISPPPPGGPPPPPPGVIDLDELWGNPSELTAHAAYDDGTCAPSCTKGIYECPSDSTPCTACPTGCGADKPGAEPCPTGCLLEGCPTGCTEILQDGNSSDVVKDFRPCTGTGTCNGIPACETKDSSIITYQGMVDDYLASDGENTDVWALPDEQKFTGTITLDYSTSGGTIDLRVSGGNGDIAYVKDTAGNVLYAADKTGKDEVRTDEENRINTLRSSSVLAACVEPGKCAEFDIVDDAIDAIKRGKTETDKGAASLTFYGKCSSFVEGNQQPCTLAVPIALDCAGPVTTWVEGLEDTTVGDAGGRPIGFGIDKELKFPKEVWKPSPEKTTLFETQTVKIYYYCPDGAGTLESRTTTPKLVADGYMAAATAAAQALSNYFPVTPEDYGLPPCPESAINRTDTTDELSCTCDKGTTFCTRVESGHVTMLSPVEVAVVVICVLIVVLVAICMCAFAAKKKMIVKEVKHGPGNAL